MNESTTIPYRNFASALPLRGCLMLAFILTVFGASGVTNNVSSIAALQAAVDAAAPGDVVVLADGIYSNNTINIDSSDITVRAATPGAVFLNGANAITISGEGVTFSGFQFTNGSIGGNVINVNGSHNLLTQLNFKGYTAQKYINIQAPSQSNQITYCNFENKPTNAVPGNLVHVGADASVVGYHKIRYCSFQDIPGPGGDFGNECIRLSNGAQSNYIARTVVEYCYFNNTGGGDGEAISVKCRGNVLRYNTFTNNQDAMLTFRNGNDNVAYGNFFLSAGGIRVKEANNIFCYNNYFENSGVGGSKEAVALDYISPNCSNINFLHNLFVDCGNIDLGGTGPKTNTWANNIFKKSTGNIFINANTGTTWSGNIRSGTLGITIPSGMTNTNPQLVLNTDGYYGLASNSPAIDAASTNYPAIPDIANVDDDSSLLLDISGQARPVSKALKDVGCDEFGTNGTLNRPLALSDVGPSYLGGPSGAVAPSIAPQPQSQTVIAGAPVSFWIGATGTAPLIYQWRKDGTNIAGATGATNTIAAAQSTSAGNYTVVVTNVAGSITSAVATLTVNIPPAIDTEPQSQSVNAGSPASFWVSATGTAPLAYQWRKDGTNLVGVIGPTNTLLAAQSGNAGSYDVVVTNVAGSVTSLVATLTVNAPPSISTEPQSQAVNEGMPVSFFVVATGTGPLSYQWLIDGTNLVGAVTATNAIVAAQTNDAGSYAVIVTNIAGSVTSSVVTLTVNVAPTIVLNPQSLTTNAGAPASFWVIPAGTAPFSYQWQKDGTNIIGANTATNRLVAAQSADVGGYSVVVTNVAGSITSAVASLTVIIEPPQIADIVSAGGGTFTLSGTGPAGEPYRILATTNVVLPFPSWPVVGTGVFIGGVFSFTDTQSTNLSQRFYRVASP